MKTLATIAQQTVPQNPDLAQASSGPPAPAQSIYKDDKQKRPENDKNKLTNNEKKLDFCKHKAVLLNKF